MVPSRRPRARRYARRVVLTPDGSVVHARLESKGSSAALPLQEGRAAVRVEELADALRHQASTHPRAQFGIRLRPADVLERHVELPLAAQKDFERLLMLDLARSTPFKQDDVLCAHVVNGSGSNRRIARVSHLVAKRRTVEPLLQQIRAAGLEPSFIESWNEDETAALSAQFSLPGDVQADVPGSSAGRFLVAACALLAVSALTVHWGKRELSLAQLSTETARLEAEAHEARKTIEQARNVAGQLERARLLIEGRASATQILDEITRLVPDQAWIEELHLDGETVELAGLAAPASTLLSAFERSALFHDTRFTAPLRLDPVEGLERFRLQARLRLPIPGGVR